MWRCPSPPPNGHAPLRDLLPGQCLLLADENLMWVVQGQLWLDGLYVRLTSPRDGRDFYVFLFADSPAEVWMTGVTLQGNGDGERDCSDCGVISRGHVYAEGAATASLHVHASTSTWALVRQPPSHARFFKHPLHGTCGMEVNLSLACVMYMVWRWGAWDWWCACRLHLRRLRWLQHVSCFF